jgi:hypothetical protein
MIFLTLLLVFARQKNFMKPVLIFFSLLVAGVVFSQQINYTASTPAGQTVRDFLGINRSDSIDFIRWYVKLTNNKEFNLSCSYGISKPNTNGFIDEKKIVLKGVLYFKDRVLTLRCSDKILSMLVLNDNILHLLNKDGSMMVGNGGWSYTLNSMTRVRTSEVYLKQQPAGFKDSIVFEGRTPCKGIEEMMTGVFRPECYKKKWLVYLYKDHAGATSGRYRIGSTAGSYTGKWQLKESAGKTIYQLELNNGRSLSLLQVDKNIVYLMDTKGELMVGDHDFSYSLNRRIK